MPTLIAKLRKKYCNGDHEKCARFVLGKAKGADNIPKEIYPGDMEQAQQILQDS
jgi:hypothetical protein